MLEQIIASTDYELAQALPSFINPADFPHDGLDPFRFESIGPSAFKATRYNKIYTDDWLFMSEIGGGSKLFYGFVCNRNGETILGIRTPKLMAEYVWVNQQWVLREYEDFRRPKQTPAEMRFEISKDYEELKKFLS